MIDTGTAINLVLLGLCLVLAVSHAGNSFVHNGNMKIKQRDLDKAQAEIDRARKNTETYKREYERYQQLVEDLMLSQKAIISSKLPFGLVIHSGGLHCGEIKDGVIQIEKHNTTKV